MKNKTVKREITGDDSTRVIVVDLSANNPSWVGISGLSYTGKRSFNILKCTNLKGLIDFKHGATILSLVRELKNSMLQGKKVAIGFEAPMWWMLQKKERFSQEKGGRQWYVNVASQATALAYIYGYIILKYLKKNFSLNFTNDLSQFKQRKHTVLLFEAFATGSCKPLLKNTIVKTQKDENGKTEYDEDGKARYIKTRNIKWDGYETFKNNLNLSNMMQNPTKKNQISKEENLKRDKIDAVICAISFFAHYYKDYRGNSFYFDQINKTKGYYNSHILKTVRVDLNGDEYLGTDKLNNPLINLPAVSHWEAILQAISKKKFYFPEKRCEIYGIKFYDENLNKNSEEPSY